MTDHGSPMPTCDTCHPHAWHGLHCGKHVYATPSVPYQTTLCPCRGPYGTSQEETTA